jgi:hypothetical protein
MLDKAAADFSAREKKVEEVTTIVGTQAMPAVLIQRIDSGLTDGNETPLSEAGAVVADEALLFEKKKKKKNTKKSKKKNKNYRSY